MTNADLDMRVRMRAFDFLAEQTRMHGDLIPHRVLSAGFTFEDVRVPLIGPQGIFKPAVLPEIPLTIRTAPVAEGRRRPYDDRMDQDGFLKYRYRGRGSASWWISAPQVVG